MAEQSVTSPLRSWRVYRFAGQAVFAVPESPRTLRRAGLARFQPFSPKRAAYRRLLQLAIRLRVDGWFSTASVNPLALIDGIDFDFWINRQCEPLSSPHLLPVVFWPPQIDRGRIYVHLLDEDFDPVAFAKISFDDVNDRCLRRERMTLDELIGQRLRQCRVPRVLAAGEFQEHEYLVVEPAPPDASPLPRTMDAFPRRCVEEFSGQSRSIRSDRLVGLTWWPRFSSRLNRAAQAFVEDLHRAAEQHGVRIGRIHGDFGPSNVLASAGQLWVLDWEESCADGPAAVDWLSYDMAINFRWNSADPEGGSARFARRYLPRSADGMPDRGDVMLALAFMHGVGIRAAAGLIENWKPVHAH